jgi:Mg2+-importing ATPase
MRIAIGVPPASAVTPADDLVDAAGLADARELLRLSRIEADEVLRYLRTSRAGLSDHEAADRLAGCGMNGLPAVSPPTWPRRMWTSLRNPFVLLLVGLDVAVAATGDPVGVFLISLMVVTSVALRLYHQRRFDRLTAFLHDLAGARVTVIRRPGRGGGPAVGPSPQPATARAR